MGTLVRSAGIGMLAAMRTFAPAAWAVSPESTRTRQLWLFAAGFETVFDKMPFVQARTTPPQLIGRVLSGAAAAAFANREAPRRLDRIGAGITGAVAAVVWTYAAYNLRKRIGARFHVPDAVVGLAEDGMSIGLGRLLAG